MLVRYSLASIALAGVFAFGGAAFADGDCPHGGHRGPPKEALTACDGKAEGAACSVVLHDETKAGTCRAPSGKPLACMPSDMGPPPDDDG